MYMKLREDQEKVRTLLCDTVTLLCKNGLTFSKELRVEGLLGITLDQTEVFIVHINEKLGSDDINGVVKDTTAGKANGQLEIISPRQKSKKRSHLENNDEESSPAKRSNYNHHSNHSISSEADLYDTYNNNVSETFIKIKKEAGEEEQGQEDEEATTRFLEDDRNAMRFCYNLEEDEPGRVDITAAEDRVPSRGSQRSTSATAAGGATKQGSQQHSPGGGSVGAGTNCGGGNEFVVDNFKPSDPSMGGPFIAGIVNDVERRVTGPDGDGDDGEDDDAWIELPQLGSLVVDGESSAALDSAGWTTNPGVKGRRHGKQPPDSLLYLSQYANTADHHHGSNLTLKSKEGRRSWTSKNKPYACKVPGCNKSYFFIHDLRRHERQKHADVVMTLSTSNPQAAGEGDGEGGAENGQESDQES